MKLNISITADDCIIVIGLEPGGLRGSSAI